jgi:hypothetical protein
LYIFLFLIIFILLIFTTNNAANADDPPREEPPKPANEPSKEDISTVRQIGQYVSEASQKWSGNLNKDRSKNAKSFKFEQGLYNDTGAVFPLLKIKVSSKQRKMLEYSGNLDLIDETKDDGTTVTKEGLSFSLPLDCSQQLTDQISASFSRKGDSTLMYGAITKATDYLGLPELQRWLTTAYDASSLMKKLSLPFLVWVTPEHKPSWIINMLSTLQSLCYPLSYLIGQLPPLLEVSVGSMYVDFEANLQSVSITTDSTWLVDRKDGEKGKFLDETAFPFLIRGNLEFVNIHAWVRNAEFDGLKELTALKDNEWKLFGNTQPSEEAYTFDLQYRGMGKVNALKLKKKGDALTSSDDYKYDVASKLKNKGDALLGSGQDYSYEIAQHRVKLANSFYVINDPRFTGQKWFDSQRGVDYRVDPSWLNTPRYNIYGTEYGINEPLHEALNKILSGNPTSSDTVANNYSNSSTSSYNTYQVQVGEYSSSWDRVYQGMKDDVNTNTSNVNLAMDISGAIRKVGDTISALSSSSTLSNIKYSLQDLRNTYKRIQSGSYLNEINSTINKYVNDIKDIANIFG